MVITIRSVVRACVCLHAVALLALPKNSFGLSAFRPEDFTGVLLLIVFAVLAVSMPLEVPSPAFASVVLLYSAYFFAVVLVRDVPRGYPQASVFWFKEASYIVFAYLAWRGYRDSPAELLTALTLIAVPNLLYGLFQLLHGPKGLYGVSPFGHEQSPSSSGMVYFAFAVILFAKSMISPRAALYWPLLAFSTLLMVAAGSKVATLGALCFFGWYLVLVAAERRDIRSIRRLAGFAVAALAALSLAVWAARFGYGWHALARYRGLMRPLQTLAERGIWWKFDWIADPLSVFVGAGYSPAHIAPDGSYSFGMAMDNQILYYLVTGGVIGLALYALLVVLLYTAIDARVPEGKILRALVVAYVVMGLGGEVLQLSVHGNVFWMMVGICLTMLRKPVAVPGVSKIALQSPRCDPSWA
jgi:hypothetical protein